MTKALETQRVGDSLLIRFIRPEIRNPLSTEVLTVLHLLFDRVEASDFDKVIFTGTGDVFASGADLREIAAIGADGAREYALRGQSLMKKIASCGCETIAAVNGICFGGGLDLSVSCSRRIASPAALFSHPGANLGIITGWGGTQRLPRLIGEGRALEILFTARRVSAEESLFIGLVDQIAEDPAAAALTAAA